MLIPRKLAKKSGLRISRPTFKWSLSEAWWKMRSQNRCTKCYETEGKTLDPDRSRAAIVKGIQSPAIGTYLLAWDENDPDKKPVGTMMCTKKVQIFNSL